MRLSSAIRAASFAVIAGLLACDSPTAPRFEAESGSALLTTTGKKITCPGSSGGVCEMDVNVLMTEDGKAVLIVRTGGYDEATGAHEPNGTFDKIQYKIYNEKGKLVTTKNDDASGVTYVTSLPGTFKPAYRVEVQANIKNHNGKKGNAVVRGVGTAAFLPDIDLSGEAIALLVEGDRLPLSSVVAGSNNTYVVDFSNLTTVGGGISTNGIRAMCVVTVDGAIQIPGFKGFSYVGSALMYLGPGETEPCTFTLKLPAGEHTIKVTAVSADLFLDRDPRNNSVTAQVVAGSPADVAASALVRIVEGAPVSPLGEVIVGTTHNFRAAVSSPAGSLNAAATCTALLDGVAIPADRIQWTTQSVQVAGGSTELCEFAVTFPTAGTFNLRVVASAAGDPNAANDSVEGSIVVKTAAPTDVTADLVVRSVTPVAPIVAGSGPVTYTAKIGVLAGGSESSAAFTCVVTTAPAATVTMLPVSGAASTTADAECRFTVDGFTTSGVTDASYQITATATPSAANEIAPENNATTVTQVVRARTVDLVTKSLRRDSGAGLVTIDTVPADLNATYVATIGTRATTGATTTSAGATCTAVATNLTTNATQNVTGTVAGTASTTSDATCTFTLALAGNGDFDQLYRIDVTAQPIGVPELPSTGADNVVTATQKAIVRVDVGIALAGIQMFVDGAERPSKDTISLNKAALFVAHFQNFSTRPATIRCEASVRPPGGLPTPILLNIDPVITIPPGVVIQCPFSYNFAEPVVGQFEVRAVPIQPLDSDPSDNVGGFSITPVSNLAFPELDRSNVDAQEDGLEPTPGTITRLTLQRVGISRVILAFTNRAETIGDFVLTVKGTTNNGQQFTSGVFTAPGLKPGGLGTPNCVAGVDAGAAQTLNGLDVRMEICAEEAPGQPNIQAISVTYSSGLSVAPLENPTGLFGIGSTISFDLELKWRLFGSTSEHWDRATGLLEFEIQRRLLDPEFGLYRKTPTGTVRIIRNGP